MQLKPVALNAATAWLFMTGSALFVLGSVPAYVEAVGQTAGAATYAVGSVFFTVASYAQLVQAQSPAMTGVDKEHQDVRAPVRLHAWLPHDPSWLAAVTQFPGTLFFNVSTFAALAHNATTEEERQHVWRPDIYGSTLFLVSSAFALLAIGGVALKPRLRSQPWRIAWLNMVGSILFMVSAIASFVLTSGELLNQPVSVGGTLLGALCFLIGAALMLPAWSEAVHGVTVSGSPADP